MFFKDRKEAGEKLCSLLTKYKDSEVVIYAVPRGGVSIAQPIAEYLHVPIDLLFAHKIGHPLQPEYAVAAVSENGQMIINPHEEQYIDSRWLQSKKEEQLKEIKLKRQKYLGNKERISIKNKVVIVVDDGIATGLTLQAGIKELRNEHPKQIVIAVPVAPRDTANFFATLVDDFIAVEIQKNEDFLGSIGAYYIDFAQVNDEEVINILHNSS